MDPYTPSTALRVRARRPRRRAQAAVWGARLGVAAMLAVAVGLGVGESRGLLRQLVTAGQPQVIPVILTDTTLDPAVVVLRPGPARFAVRNTGPTTLRFSVRGAHSAAQTPDLPPGARAQLDVTFTRPGTYTLSAARPGAEGRATGTLTVRR